MNKPLESYIKSHDQHRLYYQVWKVSPAKGVLIFVHGLNEHSGRYTYPIRHFSKKGYTLYLFDHRGHGKSDGIRSFVENFTAYLKDLNEFTEFVLKEEKGEKVFLVGHSMGGQIAINYVAHYHPPLAGLVTSSANIRMAVIIPSIKKIMVSLLSRFCPRMMFLNEIDPAYLSHDREVVREYKRDPLVSKKITLKLAHELMSNLEHIQDLAKKIRIPSLILHGGDDRICSPEGSRRFYRNLAASDKTLRIYDGFYHEIFNEIGKEKVFKDMDDWLENHR